MRNKEKLGDQVREHQILPVRYGTVAALEECYSCVKIGIITDISKSGLSFCYLDLGSNNTKKKPPESFKPKISWNISEFYMDDVPCEVISEQEISPDFSCCNLPMKKCKVRFDELMPEQASKLEQFIENFTDATQSIE